MHSSRLVTTSLTPVLSACGPSPAASSASSAAMSAAAPPPRALEATDSDSLAVPSASSCTHKRSDADAAAASSSSAAAAAAAADSAIPMHPMMAGHFAQLSLNHYNGTAPAPSPSPANSPIAPYDMTPMSFKRHKIEVLNAGSIKRKHQRILVTGGAGFIGSHLIERLMKDENNVVICVDNCFSGNKSNIQIWLNHPRFEFIRHDVTTELQLEVDQIYHLACPASPVFYQNNGIRTIKTSVLGTLNMLGLAKRLNARILFSSTSEVYGDPDVHPQVEEYNGNVNPIGIRSCYDEGKRMAESLCFEYFRQHNVQIRIARLFNTYGPRMLENDGRVVSNFIVQALSKKPITIYGDGTQTRSFCYIDDMVEGLIRMMNGDHIGPINLGNPEEYTISQLAEQVQALVDPSASVIYEPMPSDDPRKRRPDISKAQQFLDGWTPKVPLKEGLKKTIRDFARRQKAGDF